MSFCPQCGSSAEKSHRFCPNCGARLVEDRLTSSDPAASASGGKKSKLREAKNIRAELDPASDLATRPSGPVAVFMRVFANVGLVLAAAAVVGVLGWLVGFVVRFFGQLSFFEALNGHVASAVSWLMGMALDSNIAWGLAGAALAVMFIMLILFSQAQSEGRRRAPPAAHKISLVVLFLACAGLLVYRFTFLSAPAAPVDEHAAKEPTKPGKPDPAAKPRKDEAKPEIGTLKVALGGATEDPIWLYIDRKLVKAALYKRWPEPGSRYRNPAEIPLKPGRYFVELCHSNSDDHGPRLKFMSRQVEIATSTETKIHFEIPGLVARAFEPVRIPDYGKPERHAQIIRDLCKRAEDNMRLFELDLLAITLTEAHAKVLTSPPKRRALFLNLPEEHGGPREVDAEQIRQLTSGLVHKCWGWFPFSVEVQLLLPTETGPAADELRRRRDDLLARKDRHITLIRELNVVARLLESASED